MLDEYEYKGYVCLVDAVEIRPIGKFKYAGKLTAIYSTDENGDRNKFFLDLYETHGKTVEEAEEKMCAKIREWVDNQP